MDEGESGPRVGWVEGLARVEGARSYAATHRAALMTAPAIPGMEPCHVHGHPPPTISSHPCNIFCHAAKPTQVAQVALAMPHELVARCYSSLLCRAASLDLPP